MAPARATRDRPASIVTRMEEAFVGIKGRQRTNGEIDYRFTRRATLRRLSAGELTRADVCDAQLELMRVATSCSEGARGDCPVCGGSSLRLVRFVFGPRLPKGGRCVSSARELKRLGERSGSHRCYVVEVCVGCRWNHLLRSFLLRPVEMET